MENKLKIALEEMKSHLINGIIPFWLKNGNDKEFGGYLTNYDENGLLCSDTDKYIVTQTRMIWGLSALHSRFPANKALLESAKQGTDFFIEHFWDKSRGGWYWKTARDGRMIDDGKVVYGQSFAIYALSEYYKATGDIRGLEYASRTFDLLMKYCADTQRGGYYENLENDWSISAAGVFAGDRKSLDIHMHLLEAYTNLYDASKSEIHKRRLIEVINLINDRMINHATGCGRNQFNLDLTPIPAINIYRTWNAERVTGETIGSPADTTSYGHNLELVWLLDNAAVTMGLGRGAYLDIMKELTDHSLKNGFDYKFGGIYRDGPSDGPAIIKDKEWWQNCEALVGLLYAYRIFGDSRYLDAFLLAWEFDKTYFINNEVGEWRQLLTREGKVISGSIGNPWKAIYHSGRAINESIKCIEDILSSQTELIASSQNVGKVV
jgi:mannobiose 2-epimerase